MSKPNFSGGPTTPPRPMLPNPGVAENGKVACNEPLHTGGQVVGYCGRFVKRHKPWHRGPHRLEWWSR